MGRQRQWLYPSLAVSALILRAPTFTRRMFDPDEAAIAVQAMVVRSGGTLYRDIFDRKPPLPALAYAASFSVTDSLDLRPLRVVITVFIALAAMLLAADAGRRWGAAAAWWSGGLFLAATMSFYPADAGSVNFAHFALLPGVAALVWSRRGRAGWALAAGAALGLAVLCRQSYLLATVPAAFSAWRSGRWTHAPAVIAGAAVVVASTGLYVPFGAFWQWNVTNSPSFVFAGTEVGPAAGRGALSLLGFVALHVTLVAAAAVAYRRRRREDLDLWVWVLAATVSAAAGLRFFGHYWLQVVPPLVVLATPVVIDLRARWRQLAVAGVVVPLVVTSMLLFVPGSFRHRPDPEPIASVVAADSRPTDRVFVWGSYPEVLVSADRLPAGKLVHSDFVTGRSGGRSSPEETLNAAVPGAYRLMLDDLRAHPPAVVVDTSGCPQLGYEHYPLSLFPELEHFVTSRYTQVEMVDGISVWRITAPVDR